MLRIIIILLCTPLLTLAQVGIGTNQPEPSAQLEVKSTNKGFLPPRVALTSTTDNTTISTPVAGLLVYCTGTAGLASGYYYWSGAAWVRLALSNEVVNSIGTISNTSNSNGATITSGVLSLTPADATNGGIVTTNSQTIAGSKTFSSDIVVNGVKIGRGSGNNEHNVAIGADALASGTGTRNTAVGHGAMRQYNGTSFDNNTSIGYFNMPSLTSGNGNTSVGAEAMLAITTGTQNTSIGNQSLINTTGNNNVGVGKRAGQTITTGSQNTILGTDADVSTNSLSNATAIGYGATVTATNTIQLGNNSITNVNTSGTLTAGTVTYPNSDGTNGQVLTTNGSGTASWATPGGPTGTITMFAGSSAPSGYLFCDGSAVSRTTYANLFAIIGTTYGTGDGNNTFNLPDLSGRVPVGSGLGAGLTNRTLGSSGGAETHTLTINEMPSHNHSVSDPGHSHATAQLSEQEVAISMTTITSARLNGSNTYTSINTTGITINSTGGGQAHNNMQPYLALNYIIKL